jgi:hypothetical protein
MNVSSLSDWPLAYRRISFAYDEKARRLQVKADLLPRGAQPNASYADLLAAWEAQTCAADRSYRCDIRSRGHGPRQATARFARGSLRRMAGAIPGTGLREAAKQSLYMHAQAYQDELLRTLEQVGTRTSDGTPTRCARLALPRLV